MRCRYVYKWWQQKYNHSKLGALLLCYIAYANAYWPQLVLSLLLLFALLLLSVFRCEIFMRLFHRLSVVFFVVICFNGLAFFLAALSCCVIVTHDLVWHWQKSLFARFKWFLLDCRAVNLGKVFKCRRSTADAQEATKRKFDARKLCVPKCVPALHLRRYHISAVRLSVWCAVSWQKYVSCWVIFSDIIRFGFGMLRVAAFFWVIHLFRCFALRVFLLHATFAVFFLSLLCSPFLSCAIT